MTLLLRTVDAQRQRELTFTEVGLADLNKDGMLISIDLSEPCTNALEDRRNGSTPGGPTRLADLLTGERTEVFKGEVPYLDAPVFCLTLKMVYTLEVMISSSGDAALPILDLQGLEVQCGDDKSSVLLKLEAMPKSGLSWGSTNSVVTTRFKAQWIPSKQNCSALNTPTVYHPSQSPAKLPPYVLLKLHLGLRLHPRAQAQTTTLHKMLYFCMQQADKTASIDVPFSPYRLVLSDLPLWVRACAKGTVTPLSVTSDDE